LQLVTCFKNNECCLSVELRISTFWLRWLRSRLELESIVIEVVPIEADTLKFPAAAAATNWAPLSCLRSFDSPAGSLGSSTFKVLPDL